jgi:hypothetical protein
MEVGKVKNNKFVNELQDLFTGRWRLRHEVRRESWGSGYESIMLLRSSNTGASRFWTLDDQTRSIPV